MILVVFGLAAALPRVCQAAYDRAFAGSARTRELQWSNYRARPRADPAARPRADGGVSRRAAHD